jgi:hypothetical protein
MTMDYHDAKQQVPCVKSGAASFEDLPPHSDIPPTYPPNILELRALVDITDIYGDPVMTNTASGITKEDLENAFQAGQYDVLDALETAIQGVTDHLFGFLPITDSVNKKGLERWIKQRKEIVMLKKRVGGL